MNGDGRRWNPLGSHEGTETRRKSIRRFRRSDKRERSAAIRRLPPASHKRRDTTSQTRIRLCHSCHTCPRLDRGQGRNPGSQRITHPAPGSWPVRQARPTCRLSPITYPFPPRLHPPSKTDRVPLILLACENDDENRAGFAALSSDCLSYLPRFLRFAGFSSLSRKAIILRRSQSSRDALIWHSQMTRSSQPSLRNARRVRLSLAALRPILATQ